MEGDGWWEMEGDGWRENFHQKGKIYQQDVF